MAKEEVSRVKACEIDLKAKRQEYQFTIEEKDGMHFYKEEIKLECVAVDTGEGIFSSRPGKITGERSSGRSAFGNVFKITYTPDVKTMPGRYRMHVPFRTGRGKPEVCKVSVEFKVVDTTPYSLTYGNNAKEYVVDLDTPGALKGMIALQLSGPRGQKADLAAHYVKDENGAICVISDQYTAGILSANKIAISGAGKTDIVQYYPAKNARCGTVHVIVNFPKAMKKFTFPIEYKSMAGCKVYYQNMLVSEQQVIPVNLKQSLATGPLAYSTTLEGLFTIKGPPQSKVSIRMVWNGESHGHNHSHGSTNELATGKFSGFNRASDYWVPEKVNAQVIYNNISYSTQGMSGQITVRVSFHNKDDKLLKTVSFYLDVRYQGLIELSADDNIELGGETNIHPMNHYGKYTLIRAIPILARRYGEAFDRGEFDIVSGVRPTYRKLFINDMSLRYGGRFDCVSKDKGRTASSPFKPSHNEHMFGEEVDIQTNEMNAKQISWFDTLVSNQRINEGDDIRRVQDYGFVRIKDEKKYNHFHLSIVKEQ